MADNSMQDKIKSLRDKLELQKQQVEVLTDFWNLLFPDPEYAITQGQFLVWLRRYDFDSIAKYFEEGAVWLSMVLQKIEEGEGQDSEPEPHGKINLIKIVSKKLSDNKIITAAKERR